MLKLKLLSAKRILLLDDDPLALEVVAAGLEEAGARIVCAQNLSSAKELLESGEIEAVILDLNLEGGNSLGLASEIRQRTPRIPVFALTAQDIDSLSEAERSVFDEILPKWTLPEALAERLARAFNISDPPSPGSSGSPKSSSRE